MINEIIQNLKEDADVKIGEHYIVSNISSKVIQGDMRGWLCGHFYPKGSPFHRNDIEICFKSIPVGFKEELHHHLCSFEFLLVLSGKVEYEIDGDKIIFEPGMFYILEPGNTERIVKVYEEVNVFAVRLPSVPNNKIYNEE